jgi:hypothetical protein
MESNTCGVCSYSWNDPKRGNALFCRRYPPTVEMKELMNSITQKFESGLVTAYPPIQKDGWCGEHDHLAPLLPGQ